LNANSPVPFIVSRCSARMGTVVTTDPRTVRSRLTTVHDRSPSAATATGTVRNSQERLNGADALT
jgi:hypothetical protein